MRGDQGQARRTVAPVPRRHAVEADRVEHRQAREQQQLDQREVRAEQPGHPPQARQQRRRVVDVAQAALAHPQPDDHDAVGRDQHAEVPAGEHPSRARAQRDIDGHGPTLGSRLAAVAVPPTAARRRSRPDPAVDRGRPALGRRGGRRRSDRALEPSARPVRRRRGAPVVRCDGPRARAGHRAADARRRRRRPLAAGRDRPRPRRLDGGNSRARLLGGGARAWSRRRVGGHC